MTNIIRHGDISLKEVKMPKGVTEIYTGTNFVLALGEATGHSHTLVSEKPFKVFTKGDVRYFKLDFPATVRHEEHAPLTIQLGIYRQDPELEKDWFSLSTRKVVD